MQKKNYDLFSLFVGITVIGVIENLSEKKISNLK